MIANAKPLTPLSGGVVVVIGVKSSNFDDILRSHPRVIMWESDQRGISLPANTRAVFFTRFIGHTLFAKISKEARKRRITLFNPLGTGIIARQVRELLDIKPMTEVPPVTELPVVTEPEIPSVNSSEEVKEEEMTPKIKVKQKGKLKPLMEFIIPTKSTPENVDILMNKAKEMGIKTTPASLALTIRKYVANGKPPATVKKVEVKDVTVQMLDDAIKELTALRQFFVDTVEENHKLREKLATFKKMFEDS